MTLATLAKGGESGVVAPPWKASPRARTSGGNTPRETCHSGLGVGTPPPDGHAMSVRREAVIDRERTPRCLLRQ